MTHTKKNIFYAVALLFSTAFLYSGCMSSPYYQKVYALPENEWQYNNKLSFKFEITDTAAMYQLFFLMRHTEAYPFSNIWIWVETKQPGADTFSRSRMEIPLAEISGKWMGRGMGEIWEHRMPITQGDRPMRFNKKGLYEIRIEQNMRINPLPEILQVGLRVAKMGYRKK
jgi:gliding motility-associated lipoprotein GldH